MTDAERAIDGPVSSPTTEGSVTVGTGHPGGNGRLLGVDGQTVRLEPEMRDSTRQWFYWNVEIESDVAQRLRIEFSSEVVGPRGPAVRTGRPCGAPIRAGIWSDWRWLGADSRIDGTAFRYEFNAGEQVQFALSFPYQRADFDTTVFEFESDPRLTTDSLATTDAGRAVPVVRLGTGDHTVVVAARHHACESPGSYALDGLLRGLLDTDGSADRSSSQTPSLLETHRFHIYPFGDPDGVERGDPGKHRAPHDHNRDYVDENAIAELSPIYAATSAIAADLRSLGDIDVALDFHSPYKWGGDSNDRPFFVADPATASDGLGALADRFEATTAARSTEGPTLTYDATPGIGVTKFDGKSGLCHTFSRYCSRLGADPSVALEIPYVGTDADPVTPATTRQFGRDLAVALGEWAAADR